MAKRSQKLIEAARKPVPEGTFAVGAGLLVAGLTAYGFQILSFRALPKADYTALNGLWVFVFVLAPGFFLPLEQEVSRAISDRRARGEGGGPVVRRAAIAGFGLTVVLALVTLIAAVATPLTDRIFHNRDVLVPCLVIALFTFYFQLLSRGTLSGNGRFGGYGKVLAAEGILRLIPCAALALSGVEDPLWYGLCLAIPPFPAALIALKGEHGLMEPGPPAPWAELSTNIGYLLFGSLFAQMLSYAPFLGVQILADSPQERRVAANFIVGLFLARIPILLFQAVQAALLPKLAGLAGAGRHVEFRDGMRKLVYIIVGISVVAIVAGGTVGPAVGEILFGEKFNLGHVDLALLAAGSGFFILALTLAQALIALMGHKQALVAWVVGIVVFTAVTAVAGDDLFLRVEIGSIAGSAASAAIMGWYMLKAMRRGVPVDALQNLAEQIEHEPLEI